MANQYLQAEQHLLQLKEELETRIKKIDYDTQNPPKELSEHWEDKAILTSQNEVRQNLLVEAKQELVRIDEALSRISNRTYGDCKVCSQPIPLERLEAVPYATLCMQHAS